MPEAASEFDRRAHRRQYWIWLGIWISVIVSLEVVQADLSKLFDREGLGNAASILSGFMNPDLSPDFLIRVLHLSLESLLIGVLGTVFAVVVGAFFAFFAIRVPDLPNPPRGAPRTWALAGETLRWVSRFFLGFFRSIPEIVWAYIFVRILGLGPGPAVFAIALTVGGSIGKLYSELAEAVEPRTIQAMRAMGASRWAILLFGVVPQVLRQWVAYALFRLECNIRSGTILGVVGAGGLGSEIALSIRYFEFDKLATTLLAVLSFVVALEVISAQLRKRHFRFTWISAAVGTSVALFYLDIPWGDLFDGYTDSIVAFRGMVVHSAFVMQALGQVGETLLMAWAATVLSALAAIVLAPASASPLTTSSYLPDPVRAPGPSLAVNFSIKWISRFILQSTRAMPELTLALIFVVWVGVGPLAGILAIAVHNVGVLGRLYSDVLEEVEPGPPAALQTQGAGMIATFLFGVLPQVRARIAAFTLYRFEVNVRATAMVGFVGAGGIGDALHTAISLFHLQDLALLLITMLIVVSLVDAVGDRVRSRILRKNAGEYSTSVGTDVLPNQPMPQPSLHFQYGAASFSVVHFDSVERERLVVSTNSSLPEGYCLELRAELPFGAGQTGLLVRARSLRAAGDAASPAAHTYELTVCKPGADARNFVDANRASNWRLVVSPESA